MVIEEDFSSLFANLSTATFEYSSARESPRENCDLGTKLLEDLANFSGAEVEDFFCCLSFHYFYQSRRSPEHHREARD